MCVCMRMCLWILKQFTVAWVYDMCLSISVFLIRSCVWLYVFYSVFITNSLFEMKLTISKKFTLQLENRRNKWKFFRVFVRVLVVGAVHSYRRWRCSFRLIDSYFHFHLIFAAKKEKRNTKQAREEKQKTVAMTKVQFRACVCALFVWIPQF